QFGEATDLIHHRLELAEQVLAVIRLAAGDAHRRRGLRRRGPERRWHQGGQDRGPGDPEEIAAVVARSHGCSPWFGGGRIRPDTTRGRGDLAAQGGRPSTSSGQLL